jgi:prepilin-type N-terminal cleavage/methylation domain-containing protein
MRDERGEMRKGFTLMELLLVVTIISLLAVAVFVALNPAQRLIDTKNARRTTDVDTILSAIHQSIIDDRGTYPTGLSAGMAERQIGTAGTGCAIATGGCNVTNAACLNLLGGGANDLSPYLSNVPIDPNLSSSSTRTGYSVVVNTNGIVTIRACEAEGGVTISASR